MADTLMSIPGQRLCRFDRQHTGGSGTYTRENYIYSSVAGRVSVSQQDDETSLVEVKRVEQNAIPAPGTIVTAKIASVNPRFCKCLILCAEDTVLREPFRGIIRREEVRATEKDRVEMYKCFRPGDIVLAKVIALDAHSYSLTTAENELGVVIARSEAGALMVPISWTKMQCPQTYNKESRKVSNINVSTTN